MYPTAPRNGRHHNPLWIQVPVVRQVHVGPGHSDGVVPVPLAEIDIQVRRVSYHRQQQLEQGRGFAALPRRGAGLVLAFALAGPLERHCGAS